LLIVEIVTVVLDVTFGGFAPIFWFLLVIFSFIIVICTEIVILRKASESKKREIEKPKLTGFV